MPIVTSVLRLWFFGADFEMVFNRINSVSPALPYLQPFYGGAGATLLPEPACGPAFTDAASRSDLMRPVYCVLGMPIDAISMATVVRRVEVAAANRAGCRVGDARIGH
jgi:hypothetical protein